MALTGGHELNQLTERIIGCAFTVGSALGPGFLEKVYENALAIELNEAGLRTECQKPIEVHYRNRTIGHYIADIMVERTVLVELKACAALSDAHKAQCLNYLNATGLETCLLFNFGTDRVQTQRLRR